MKRIAITLPGFYGGEADDIAAALTRPEAEGGFWRVHIRKPGATPAEIAALVESVPADLRFRLTLHDGQPLARMLGVGGVQLNGRNPRPPQGWDGLVSRSLHCCAEIEALTPDTAYAFISPVFESLSKPGYRPSFTQGDIARSIERLRQSNTSTLLIGLGGVTPSNIDTLAEAGLDGGAMLTAAWTGLRPTAKDNH